MYVDQPDINQLRQEKERLREIINKNSRLEADNFFDEAEIFDDEINFNKQ